MLQRQQPRASHVYHVSWFYLFLLSLIYSQVVVHMFCAVLSCSLGAVGSPKQPSAQPARASRLCKSLCDVHTIMKSPNGAFLRTDPAPSGARDYS